MKLGREDTLRQEDEVCRFFGWGGVSASPARPQVERRSLVRA
jgi:hypothetical protein